VSVISFLAFFRFGLTSAWTYLSMVAWFSPLRD